MKNREFSLEGANYSMSISFQPFGRGSKVIIGRMDTVELNEFGLKEFGYYMRGGINLEHAAKQMREVVAKISEDAARKFDKIINL